MTLEDGTGSPETSVSNHVTSRNNPKDGRIYFNLGGSLKSCIVNPNFSPFFAKYKISLLEKVAGLV